MFLLTDDDIIIADPENEYGLLVERFGDKGQIIDISPNSTNYINPMDINLDYSDDENPITLKSDFVLSLCDLIIGGKEGLSPVEKTIIDRCKICTTFFGSRRSRKRRPSRPPLKSMSTAA